MTPYWYIENADFADVRAKRIGASDVPALVVDPERPTESLAGYGRTAITVWEEKSGLREREPAGLAAEMGHWNEIKAIELFIRGIPEIGESMAHEYLESRMRYETAILSDPNRRASRYQPTPFKHNTQWYNDQFIVHPDGIWDNAGQIMPDLGYSVNGSTHRIVSAHGLTIDLSTPFLIEAKTASYWSAKRREGQKCSGFDTKLTSWQGIPLKHYVQIQFQLACLDVEVCYLPLITDAALGTFHVWEVRRDRKTGDDLIDRAAKLAWHIREGKRPDHLCINIDDVLACYPECTDDFRILSAEEGEKAIGFARTAKDAAKQEKAWKQKKEDANSALAVVLGASQEARVLLDGEVVPVAKWKETAGSEYVTLSELDAPTVEGLRASGYVKIKKGSKSVNVCLKEE